MSRRAHSVAAAYVLAAALAGTLAAGAEEAAAPEAPRTPRLVVLLVVDQLPPWALDPTLRGGLGRLAREGRVFADAALSHAGSETCPGHVALATGRHPGPAGAPGNQRAAEGRGAVVMCTDDAARDAAVLGVHALPGAHGRSPRFLRVPALGDWLHAAHPEARVVALSAKDRAAIPLGGRRPTAVFWLDPAAGGFTTSRYYAPRLPAWLARFHGDRPLENGFLAELPERWEHPTGAPANGARRDDFAAEADRFGRTSGHPVRGASVAETLAQLPFTPYLDVVTLSLARRAVVETGVGRDAVPDLLAVSLSATDYVGHLYGPHSQEARDARAHLDSELGSFLAFLEAAVGRRDVLLALAADHGVLPMPEWLEETGRGECPVPGGRIDAAALGQRVGLALAERFGPPDSAGHGWILQAGFALVVNRPLAEARGADPTAVRDAARALLGEEPGVAHVWVPEEIASGGGPAPFGPLFAASFDAERSGDLVVQPARGCLLSPFPTGTSHGTPYTYDRAIPLVFWGLGVDPGVVRGRARAVDVAPTLAHELGLPLPDGLDGAPLALRGAPEAGGAPGGAPPAVP